MMGETRSMFRYAFWRHERKIGNLEYPFLVAVETTNRCNAKCVFCPNNAMARDRAVMSDELFDKVIEDCREFPLEAIEPFLNGEPFVDPKIIQRIEKIRSRLPSTKVRLYSNGNALIPRKIDELIGLGIDSLYISLNTLDPIKYQQVVGLDLDRTLDNLKYLADPVRKSRVARKITVRLTRMPDTTLEEQDRFLEFCQELKVRPFIVGLFNYKGDIPSNLPVPLHPCEHIARVDVLSNGVVTLCCMDHEGEYAWGDAREQSIIEIYNGPRASSYRKLHIEGKRSSIPPCDKCNMFWPHLDNMPLSTTAKYALYAGAYFLRYRPFGRKAPLSRQGPSAG